MKHTYASLCISAYLWLSVQTSIAQVNQEWAARYNNASMSGDIGGGVVADANGNVYVTGAVLGTGKDIVTIKYNSSGVQQWAVTYNGPGNGDDIGFAIALDVSGNCYVGGYSTGSGTFKDYVAIKYNSDGVQQWAARYNGPGNGNDLGFRIVLDSAGNVYVSGYSPGAANEDMCVVKYNSSGVQQWVARYDGPGGGFDSAQDIAVDAAGNLYVVGFALGISNGNNLTTIKYNSSGTQQWLQSYNGTANGNDRGFGITIDNSGNVYATGAATNTGTGVDCCTIKYNSSGAQQWVGPYNSPDNQSDYSYVAAVDRNGNVYAYGNTVRNVSPFVDMVTLKYNSAGAQQWANVYNGAANSHDNASRMSIDTSGSVYVTGYSAVDHPVRNYDYLTIKYNTAGVQQWMMFYDFGDQDMALYNNIDAYGNVYVTGLSAIPSGGASIATLKYSQPVGIVPVSNEIPGEFKLEQNYPNPFNAVTRIGISVPLNKGGERGLSAKLATYDLLGREIAVLVTERLQPGNYEVSWDAANYPSGVYYYQLSIPSIGYSQTKSMILLK